MFHTPAHKQTMDKTLSDYVKRRYSEELLPEFDQWLDSVYVELNGKTFTRRQWWTDGEIAAAMEAWKCKK